MDFEYERLEMVKSQLKSRGISDLRVLEAFRLVPREEFVPFHLRDLAYNDSPLPIGEGQTISQPYTAAAMTELLEPKESDRVLEVGTGSGYQAAILAHLVKEVYTIERIASLAEGAKAVLDRLEATNVRVRIGEGGRGWLEKAPFDGIIVTAAGERIPWPLKEQLVEGGRLVMPVGGPFVQTLVKLTRSGHNYLREEHGGFRFVPLVVGES